MVERLEHAKLEQLTLHNNSIRWYKKEKEIIVGEILFDVHSYVIRNDSTVFIGLFDIAESQIQEYVKKLLQQSASDSAARELAIAKLILQVVIAEPSPVSAGHLFVSNGDNYFVCRSMKLSTITLASPSPPPRSEYTY